MLDYFAIHIGDVQAAVRAIAHLHWSKPNVGRCEKLAFFIHTMGDKTDSFALQSLAVNQITAYIRHKSPIRKVRESTVAAIDCDSGRTRKITGGRATTFDRPRYDALDPQACPHDPPRFNRARTENGCLWPVGCDAPTHGRWFHVRISARVAIFESDKLYVVAVRANKFVPP